MVMLCAITLCMLACVQCLEHSSNVKHNAISQQVALSKINNEGSDTITKERMTKRAVGQATAKGLYALQKLLNDAKNVKTRSNSFRRYEKMGNADTALRDFYSVYPTNIQRKANFRFGTIQQLRDGSVITGQVGNKRLILLTSGDKRSRGRPVLEIRTAIEPVYDKIIYKPKVSDK